MTDALQTLYNEHDVIIFATDLVKDADKLIIKDERAYEKVIRMLINFFRVYADEYHHHKEEQILFPEMNKKNELLEGGIVNEMLENHKEFRSLIDSIEVSLEKKDYLRTQQELNVYKELLLDHIAVENDEVFQMAESLLNDKELQNIYFSFCDSDLEIDKKNGQDLNKAALINQLTNIKKLIEDNS